MRRYFSIIEMIIVITVILLLTSLSVAFYKTVQKSTMVKSQIVEFENIKLGINSYKLGMRSNVIAASKRVTIYDLIYKHHLITEKRKLIEDKDDPSKLILSYFNTPIKVYLCKVNIAKSAEETDYVSVTDNEFLTGDFEFYFGNDHEKDGGEPGNKFGLSGGKGTDKDTYRYYYKFVYSEPDDGPTHEFYFH